MPYDFNEEISDGSVQEYTNEIDPRDTYGSRFSVTSRRVTNSQTPRSAIVSGSSRLRNSNKIFTKKKTHENLGGRVNMENVSNSKVNEEKNIKENTKENKKRKSDSKLSGLDSLFESTTNDKNSDKGDGETKAKANSKSSTSEHYSEVQNRPLKVIKPISFNSANEISSALKAGSAVVLCLKGINEGNARRLLDFAFGAAAMCGAKVSLEAQKTYVITIGPGLSQREKLLCIKEGVALKVDESEI